jgi:hypothetical protein
LYTRWGYFSLSNPYSCLTYTSSSNTLFRKALFTSIWCNLNPLAMEKARRILISSKGLLVVNPLFLTIPLSNKP